MLTVGWGQEHLNSLTLALSLESRSHFTFVEWVEYVFDFSSCNLLPRLLSLLPGNLSHCLAVSHQEGRAYAGFRWAMLLSLPFILSISYTLLFLLLWCPTNKLIRTSWRGEVLFWLHWSSQEWLPITPFLKLTLKLCYKKSLYFPHLVIELLITRSKERFSPMLDKTSLSSTV